MDLKYVTDWSLLRRVRCFGFFGSLVWGGVHPTLLPEQTVANEFVDIVVRGEGEQTLCES